MEKPLKIAWVGLQIGCDWVSGDHQGRVKKVLVRLMETQIWHLPASACWVRGGINKYTIGSSSTSVWEKAAPPAFVLKPNNPVSSLMSLAAAPALELRVSEFVYGQIHAQAI